MKYGKFITASSNFAGFDTCGHVSFEGDWGDIDFSNIEEYMQDYIMGYCNESDEEEYGEDEVCAVSFRVDEISKEEFDECMDWYSECSIEKGKNWTIYFNE